jgi:hypothetical protein
LRDSNVNIREAEHSPCHLRKEEMMKPSRFTQGVSYDAPAPSDPTDGLLTATGRELLLAAACPTTGVARTLCPAAGLFEPVPDGVNGFGPPATTDDGGLGILVAPDFCIICIKSFILSFALSLITIR